MPTTRAQPAPLIRDILRLIDKDETGLMPAFVAQAIHEFAKHIIIDTKMPLEESEYWPKSKVWPPAWVKCAEQCADVMAEYDDPLWEGVQ